MSHDHVAMFFSRATSTDCTHSLYEDEMRNGRPTGAMICSSCKQRITGEALIRLTVARRMPDVPGSSAPYRRKHGNRKS